MSFPQSLHTEDALLVARSARLELERRRQPRAVDDNALAALAERFFLQARDESPGTPREELRRIASDALRNTLLVRGVA